MAALCKYNCLFDQLSEPPGFAPTATSPYKPMDIPS
jgi:hypothetical protein